MSRRNMASKGLLARESERVYWLHVTIKWSAIRLAFDLTCNLAIVDLQLFWLVLTWDWRWTRRKRNSTLSHTVVIFLIVEHVDTDLLLHCTLPLIALHIASVSWTSALQRSTKELSLHTQILRLLQFCILHCNCQFNPLFHLCNQRAAAAAPLSTRDRYLCLTLLPT